MTKKKSTSTQIEDNSVPLDPTINVQNLLKAAVLRLDDLATASAHREDDLRLAELHRLQDAFDAEKLRVDQEVAGERRRVDEQLELRSHYEGMLREAEAKRIDAIRIVDVNAVAVASERAAAQATVLANQVVTSADTLRSLVASTATALAQQLAQVQSQYDIRISNLERSSYEGKGRETRDDPAMALLSSEIRAIGIKVEQNQSKGVGAASAINWIVIAIGMVSIIIGIVMTLR